MAAPAFISKGTASYHSKGEIGISSPVTVTPSVPASPQANDVIWYLLHFSSETEPNGDAITTPPSGFTLAASETVASSSGTNRGLAALYYKRSDGTEAGTVTAEVTWAGTKNFPRLFAQMYLYRDVVTTGDPFDDIQTTDRTGLNPGSATITWPAVTLAGSTRTLAAFVGQSDNIAAGTPTGYTEQAVDTNSADIGLQLELNDFANQSADGAVTATGGASRGWRTFHVAVLPSAEGGVIAEADGVAAGSASVAGQIIRLLGAARSVEFRRDFLKLIFNATPIPNLAVNAATSPATTLTIALHTTDPGEGGTQATNETAYTGYARVAVARTTAGWAVTDTGPPSASPVASINFPECTANPGAALTHWSIGTGVGNRLLYSGELSPSIAIAVGVDPRLATPTTIAEH